LFKAAQTRAAETQGAFEPAFARREAEELERQRLAAERETHAARLAWHMLSSQITKMRRHRVKFMLAFRYQIDYVCGDSQSKNA
jgi:hypothetical protein